MNQSVPTPIPKERNMIAEDFTDDQVLDILNRLWYIGESASSIARSYGVRSQRIYGIRSGQTYRHISRPWDESTVAVE